MRVWPVALALLTLITHGCDSILGLEGRQDVVVGVVDLHATETPGIVVPDTVEAGEDFVVTIHTGWPNGCARHHRTELAMAGTGATITPYDAVRRNAMCPQAPAQITHTATLRFAQPGTARVTVVGRAGFDVNTLVSVERDVTVR